MTYTVSSGTLNPTQLNSYKVATQFKKWNSRTVFGIIRWPVSDATTSFM